MSGLILLVIVGAWLAVLVPMALRSHDSGRSLSTVDKFHDAMRVLSRRDALVGPGPGSGPVGPPGPPRPPSPGTPAPRPRTAPAAGPTVAARRRRVLVGLAVTALTLLVAGLLGPRWLLAAHALADLLLVAYLGHLRHQTVLRHEREWREALGERVPAGRVPVARTADRTSRDTASADRGATRAAEVATPPLVGARPAAGSAARVLTRPANRAAGSATVRHAAPGRIAGIPDRMPPRELPVVAEVPAGPPVPAPVRGAVGEPWAPVPVPLPGYVTAAKAPRRVLDLTRPGEWSDGVAAAERELGIDDQGPALEEILERRRAAGDW